MQTDTAFLTTSVVAKRLAVSTDQIVALIHAGHLRAINVAARSGKPRWRISTEAIDAFVAARTTTPPMPQTRRRKRRDPAVIEFF